MFRKLLITPLIALCAASFASAQTIDFTEAANHVGEQATVTGKVSRVSTLPSGMTFVNFGVRGQAGGFTAVARPGTADADTLKGFEGKVVEVTGTIAIYKDSPQIVLKAGTDIRLQGDAGGAASNSAIKTFKVPLVRKEIKAAGETSGGEVPKEAYVTVSFPAQMEKGKAHPILAVFSDFHNNGDLEQLIAPYAQVVNPKGWIVIAARGSSLEFALPPVWHTVMFQAAFRQLDSDYPGIATWPVYLAGNSDGAGRATLSIGGFMEEDFDLRGCYLSSLKREELTKSMEVFDPSNSKLKRLKIFVSLGKDDSMVSEKDSLEQAELIKEAGIKLLRHEVHDGRTGVDAESLQKALEWFQTTEE